VAIMSGRNAIHGGRSQISFMKLLDSSKPIISESSISFSEADIALHCKEWDCWIVLNRVVYDVTIYLEYHPGGKDDILKYAGKDATVAFNSVHPWINIQAILGKLAIGRALTDSTQSSLPLITAGTIDGTQRSETHRQTYLQRIVKGSLGFLSRFI